MCFVLFKNARIGNHILFPGSDKVIRYCVENFAINFGLGIDVSVRSSYGLCILTL